MVEQPGQQLVIASGRGANRSGHGQVGVDIDADVQLGAVTAGPAGNGDRDGRPGRRPEMTPDIREGHTRDGRHRQMGASRGPGRAEVAASGVGSIGPDDRRSVSQRSWLGTGAAGHQVAPRERAGRAGITDGSVADDYPKRSHVKAPHIRGVKRSRTPVRCDAAMARCGVIFLSGPWLGRWPFQSGGIPTEPFDKEAGSRAAWRHGRSPAPRRGPSKVSEPSEFGQGKGGRNRAWVLDIFVMAMDPL
jgi:hypothetical protein